MTAESAERLRRFFSTFSAVARPLLLLDYDGTLAPFRVDRFQARPWAGVRELLAALQRQGKTRMAVITGRPSAEIAPLLGLDPPLEVWGLHGAERRMPDGRCTLQQAPAAARRALDKLRTRLLHDSLGGLYEDKPNAVVMHWRGLGPRQAAQVERRTRELFEPLARLDGLALLPFAAGIELRVGRDKGGAVETILQEAGPGARPVAFLGDDITDEAAFRAINRASGPHLSVLMRRAARPSAARVWLRPPAELRAFLKRWLEAL